MRILVVLHNFVPEPTLGAETAAIGQMRELMRAGHQVALFYAGNSPPGAGQLAALGLEDLELIRVPYLPTRAQVLLGIRKPWVERAFARALEALRPDAVLFHHLARLSLELPWVAARAGVPAAYVLHDYYWLCPSYSLFAWDANVCPGGSPRRCAQCLFVSRYGRRPPPGLVALGSLALRWRQRVVRRALRGIGLFVSPSRSIIEGAGARGVKLAPAVVIPNGQPPVVPLPSVVPTAGRVRFGYIGGVSPKKGLDVLVRAFSGERGRHLTIRGFADAAALAAFREAHPGFQGTLELFDADRTAFFRQVDVVVVPSTWLENQPMVVLEAFAHGRPVLASRIGGLPELFREGAGGRFFAPGDPDSLRQVAEALAADPAAVTRLAAAIPDWPDWTEATRWLLADLEALISAGRRPGWPEEKSSRESPS